MDDNDHWLAAFLLRQGDHSSSTDLVLRTTLLNFLEVLDSLDRLITTSIDTLPQPQSALPDWLHQLQLLQRQLLQVFSKSGVTFFDTVGHPFNPAQHEAVKIVHQAEKVDGVVVAEVTRGCSWQGNVLRYAKVIVNQH